MSFITICTDLYNFGVDMTRDMNEKLHLLSEQEDMPYNELKILWYMTFEEAAFKAAIRDIKKNNIEVSDYVQKLVENKGEVT